MQRCCGGPQAESCEPPSVRPQPSDRCRWARSYRQSFPNRHHWPPIPVFLSVSPQLPSGGLQLRSGSGCQADQCQCRLAPDDEMRRQGGPSEAQELHEGVRPASERGQERPTEGKGQCSCSPAAQGPGAKEGCPQTERRGPEGEAKGVVRDGGRRRTERCALCGTARRHRTPAMPWGVQRKGV